MIYLSKVEQLYKKHVICLENIIFHNLIDITGDS